MALSSPMVPLAVGDGGRAAVWSALTTGGGVALLVGGILALCLGLAYRRTAGSVAGEGCRGGGPLPVRPPTPLQASIQEQTPGLPPTVVRPPTPDEPPSSVRAPVPVRPSSRVRPEGHQPAAAGPQRLSRPQTPVSRVDWAELDHDVRRPGVRGRPWPAEAVLARRRPAATDRDRGT